MKIGFSITVVERKKFYGAISTTSGKEKYSSLIRMEKLNLLRTSVGNGVEKNEFLHAALEHTINLENNLTIRLKMCILSEEPFCFREYSVRKPFPVCTSGHV